jgi:DNA-binding response OmpR family regulator
MHMFPGFTIIGRSEKAIESNSYLWLLLIVPLSFAGIFMKDKFGKKEEKVSIFDDSKYMQLGNYRFYTDNSILEIENRSIKLSEKETNALKIFAENINQIVERETLMKEIWEDKGIVVISRNVDVLVSKLRKKLSDDTSLKFMNVHGRGYKFSIE